MLKRLLLCFLCAFAACAYADDKITTLIRKDLETRHILGPQRSLADTPPSSGSMRSFSETTFTDTWCKTLTLTYWSNSKHPGYEHPEYLNQNQRGVGWKCRKDGDHPTFVSVDTMINSQFGSTMALSIGKQIDLINWRGIRYYRGASLTGLSYEMPGRHRTAYGIAPITHRGVSADLSELFPIQLPRKFKGTVGWEELRLPIDGIRVRSWNAEIRMNF
jgi:hypothetical protein